MDLSAVLDLSPLFSVMIRSLNQPHVFFFSPADLCIDLTCLRITGEADTLPGGSVLSWTELNWRESTVRNMFGFSRRRVKLGR